jgi:hypothetical protein
MPLTSAAVERSTRPDVVDVSAAPPLDAAIPAHAGIRIPGRPKRQPPGVWRRLVRVALQDGCGRHRAVLAGVETAGYRVRLSGHYEIDRRHEGAAINSDPMKPAWNDVAERFSTLGRMMKERYQGASGDEPGDATTAGSTQDARAELRQAFDRLVAAGTKLGDRAADAARDDDVTAQAKEAAASLNDALSATVDLIGEQLGGFFKRSKSNDSSPEIATRRRRRQ